MRTLLARVSPAAASMLLISAMTGSASAVGPVSILYVMNYGEFGGGSVMGLDLFQGLGESSFPTANGVDTCIGVAAADVRTLGYSTGLSGSRFNLSGGPLAGGPYTNTIQNSQLHDGTSDGAFNYSVDFATGDVLQFDRNWASPSVLFNATATLPSAGWITMNASDGTFWLSQWGGPDRVEHRTAGGLLLGSFNSGILGSAGLALDPVDGTLWMSDGSSTLFQFSQGGSLLQTVPYAMSGQFYGMEFATTSAPAPGSFLVLGVGASLLRCRRSAGRAAGFTG